MVPAAAAHAPSMDSCFIYAAVLSMLLYADPVVDFSSLLKTVNMKNYWIFSAASPLPCRFMYDIMHGVDIIIASIQPALDAASPSAAANPAAATVQEEQPLIDVPLRIAVYVTNLGIILPASSK